ncbi:dihydrodipicolinate synthase family protein [Lentisphaerota bacterium ZTH]|nr:dihydrodipicolinate synthase family protein [Lentisphaerota bacterium]WET06801.1 dihydrodipicolinate synthase family protein [Lentisphaerota bacterium ZTH]
MNNRNKLYLSGIIPPLVTPLLGKNEIDLAGLRNLIEHVIAGGVHGIFILGTTGEGPSLSTKVKQKAVKCACDAVNSRIPVLVGISDTSFQESIDLAVYAADCGADAVVLAPPYYFPSGQPELIEYLRHIAPRLPLPLILYNMPLMTKVDIAVETLCRAAEIKNVIGLKDSSGNMIRFHEYLTAMQNNTEFSLLMGPEELLAEAVMFGASGGIAGGANIWPELYVSLFDAAAVGDVVNVRLLQEKVFKLRKIYACGRFASSGIKGIKSALAILNICSDFMAEPFHAFHKPEREQVKKILSEINLIS